MRPKTKSKPKTAQQTQLGSPSIISMFKKQAEKLENKLSYIASNFEATCSDDDVKIIKVEAVSPNFNKSKSESSFCASGFVTRSNREDNKSLSLKTGKGKGRLSLNKSKTCDNIKSEDEVDSFNGHQSKQNNLEENYNITYVKAKSPNKSNISLRRQICSPERTGIGEEDSDCSSSLKENSTTKITDLDNNSQEPPSKRPCKDLGTQHNANSHVKIDDASVHTNNVSEKKANGDKMFLGNDKYNDDSKTFPEQLTSVHDPSEKDKHESSANSNIDGKDNANNDVPYYLSNFETILKSVLEDESYKQLFNPENS